jgi:hypothetical protein
MSGTQVKCSLKLRQGGEHEVQFILKPVAEGQLKIARHCSGGCPAFELHTVPQAGAEMKNKT